MKKILFIIWSYSLGGGAEALLTTIVNHLNPQKYQIGILEFYHSSTKKEPANANIKIYEPITFEGDKEYQKKMYYTYCEPDKMIGKYIPAGYDIYVSFNYQVPSFLLPDGERNIAWIHGAVYDLAEGGMVKYRQLQNKVFEKVVKIVSISDMTSCSVRTLFPKHADKLVEIYNAVNIAKIRKKADCFTQIKVQHPAIIWVGRLDDNKNPLRAIDFFQEVVRKIGSAHLYFLGKGALETKVKDRAEEYGLQEQIHVLGYMSNPFPVMKQADVCCMTSKSEGFPLSLLESVALGVPFVSTEVGGAGILSNGGRCGRIYKTNEEAAKGIMEILEKTKEALVRECESSIQRFDLDVYISRIEELFDEVLNLEVNADREKTWENSQSTDELEDRDYYYRFPKSLMPEGSRVILYGAGDVGTNYYNYINKTGLYQITAWVDAAASDYRRTGKDVKDIETIFQTEYDFLLIAVMKQETAHSIRRSLCECGISNDRILWTVPIF